MRIVELKENIVKSDLLQNLYDISKIVNDITISAELMKSINKDDFNYLEIVIEKIKVNLQKVYVLMKINEREARDRII